MSEMYIAKIIDHRLTNEPEPALFEDEHADQGAQWAAALLGVEDDSPDWFGDADELDAWLREKVEGRSTASLTEALADAGWDADALERLARAPHTLPPELLRDCDVGPTQAWFILNSLARLGLWEPIPTLRVTLELVTVSGDATMLRKEIDRWLRLSLIGARFLAEANAGEDADSPMAQAMAQGGDPLDLFSDEADSAIAHNLVWGAHIEAQEPVRFDDPAWEAAHADAWWMAPDLPFREVLRYPEDWKSEIDQTRWWIARLVLIIHPALLPAPHSTPFLAYSWDAL